MSLNNPAADAVVDAWLDDVVVIVQAIPGGPGGSFSYTPEQRAAAKAGTMGALIRRIFEGIRNNAVVSPAGSPVMTAGGDPVVGNGKIL